MIRPPHLALLVAALLSPRVAPPVAAQTAPIELAVGTERLHPVDGALFGQFLEIASWGEPGPEAFVDPRTGDLPAPVVAALRQVHAPVIRYPGGTDVDYLDWRDRVGPRPIRPVSVGHAGGEFGNAFGYPEFLRLCATLNAEPLLVLNFRDVLVGRQTAEQVAGLVSYCNAPTHPWRELDGRAEPWAVKRWQIGNEVWGFVPAVQKQRGWSDDQTAERIVATFVAIAEAVRAVTPDAEIIFDSAFGSAGIESKVLADPRVKAHLDLPTVHRYRPWAYGRVTIDGQEVDLADADADAVWALWTTMPGGVEPVGADEARTLGDMQGDTRLSGAADRLHALGYDRVACTEWNWNGWAKPGAALPLTDRENYLARGLGCAAFLNGLIRHGDRYVLGTQSMMLGTRWHIGAVHTERDDTGNVTRAMVRPTARATALYAQHHGTHRVPFDIRGDVPTVALDATLNAHRVNRDVPMLDAVATADDDRVYVHLVNRQRHDALPLGVDVSAWPDARAATLHHIISEREQDTAVVSTVLPVSNGTVPVLLPPATVAVLVVECAAP